MPNIVKVFWDTDTPQVLYSLMSSQKKDFSAFLIFLSEILLYMLQYTDKALQVFKFQDTLLGL
jgi:hypothetical protein